MGIDIFGKGIGKNKKIAEQAAAKDLIKKLEVKINEAL
ncbi:MAG: putative dsRNA-binding protein [Fusobacteriaceae bacterium]